MSAVIQRLQVLLQPVVESLGCRIWGIEYEGLGRRSVLRVFIDSEAGITVEDCANVSHQISAVLDVEDPIGTSYTLEVSSPGLDRILFALAQYAESVGERVDVRLRFPAGGRRRYVGFLNSVDEEGIVVSVDDEEAPVSVRFSEIAKTRIVPNFAN